MKSKEEKLKSLFKSHLMTDKELSVSELNRISGGGTAGVLICCNFINPPDDKLIKPINPGLPIDPNKPVVPINPEIPGGPVMPTKL